MPFRRRMSAIPAARLHVTDSFWGQWRETLVNVTLPTQFEHLVSTGRIRHFEIAAGKAEGEYEGFLFNDSDVYKWAEAVGYALAYTPAGPAKRRLEEMLTTAIEAVAAAQMPNGYLNTYIQLKFPGKQWMNLQSCHELYCAGHLIEGAVTLLENTGDRRLLAVALRFADHILETFGPDARLGYCGHEEIEIALIRLSKATGQAKYAERAFWMIEMRGRRPSVFEAEIGDPESLAISPWGANQWRGSDGTYSGEYGQDHRPIREHTDVVGHAVRAMYLYQAAAEMADGRDDAALETAIETAWQSLTLRRMYVTGGIGPSGSNEGFSFDYDLPNLTAYAETCAACGLAFWGRRLLELTGNSDYADVVERALYNGALSGISISGDRYFYDNPLESRGRHQRVPWFGCACCPPNIARLIASVGDYLASESEDTFYLHIPAAVDAAVTFQGVPVRILVEAQYPWSGAFTLTVQADRPVEFALALRIPDWSQEMSIELDGATEPAEYEDGYAVYRRVWTPGDVVKVDLDLQPRWIESHPEVLDNLGRSALIAGPLVYCAEGKDQETVPQRFAVDAHAPIESVKLEDLGVTALRTVGEVSLPDASNVLYPEFGELTTRSANLTLIPYFAWNNRGADHMQVWLRSL